tara:strand:- start:2470 stop:3651 length:1182 start_codon:yes stop_codon:yes gene_type:complete
MTGRYTIRLPLSDGTYREKVVVDENRDIFVDEIRVSTPFVITNEFLPTSPNFIDLNIRGQSQGHRLGGRSGSLTFTGSPLTASQNINKKFPFSVPIQTSEDVGDLTAGRHELAASQSTSAGYTAGGVSNPFTPPVTTSTYVNIIDKFPFSAGGNSTDVGDLTLARFCNNAGTTSRTHGYTAGGGTGGGSTMTLTNVIDKYPFSSDANATDVGDLSQAVTGGCGQSSETHGYHSAGTTGTQFTYVMDVEKYPFASDANSANIGHLSYYSGVYQAAGLQDATTGYMHGGYRSPPAPQYSSNYVPGQLWGFPFASDADSLTGTTNFYSPGASGAVSPYNAGRGSASSDTVGFVFGGYNNNTLASFPFASQGLTVTYNSWGPYPLNTPFGGGTGTFR